MCALGNVSAALRVVKQPPILDVNRLHHREGHKTSVLPLRLSILISSHFYLALYQYQLTSSSAYHHRHKPLTQAMQRTEIKMRYNGDSPILKECYNGNQLLSDREHKARRKANGGAPLRKKRREWEPDKFISAMAGFLDKGNKIWQSG